MNQNNIIRKQFPIFEKKLNNNNLIYFDNAASSQKPECVINKISDYYKYEYSNVHRGIHSLSQISTDKFEQTRSAVKEFINANSTQEIIFTKGTTESINLVASSWSDIFLNEGDEIIISTLEHHANIVPWQIVCKKKKATLKIIPIDENGYINLQDVKNLISKKTKFISLIHISNVIGIETPIIEIIKLAHKANAQILIDGAQAVSHKKIDVQKLNCDFYCFSAHKMYGPTGVGILFGKKKILEKMSPYQTGGEMIKEVSFKETTFNDLPFKFETGTPNITGIIALKESIDFINSIGFEYIQQHEKELLEFLINKLTKFPYIKILGGNNKNKNSIVSFNMKKIHHYDAGSFLNNFGIALRTGHLCAQPLMNRYNIPGTIRISFAIYNNFEEIEFFIQSLKKIKKIFQ